MGNKEKQKAYNKAYREANKEKKKVNDKAYYEANKEKIKANVKVWANANKEKIAAKAKAYREAKKKELAEWRELHKEEIAAQDKAKKKASKEKNKATRKAYIIANKEKIAAKAKAYREAIKGTSKAIAKAERKSIYDKAYCEANREKKRLQAKSYREANQKKINKYHTDRKKRDPLYALTIRIRSRTGSAFKCSGIPKNNTTQEMLGCTYEFMRDHLAAQFTEGMTLENMNEWHIDHIIPLSLGKTEEEKIELAHYTNLQPLWEEDNLKKKDNIILEQISPENRIRYAKFLNRL